MTDVDHETWCEIMYELRHGTPDTPERIATIKRADAAYLRFCQHQMDMEYRRGRHEEAKARGFNGSCDA